MLDLANHLWKTPTVAEIREKLAAAGIDPYAPATGPTDAPAEPFRAYPIPGPYEIALAVGAALAGSGRYETPGAALQAAWGAVAEFYFGRDYYVRELAPAIFGAVSPPADANGVDSNGSGA